MMRTKELIEIAKFYAELEFPHNKQTQLVFDKVLEMLEVRDEENNLDNPALADS